MITGYGAGPGGPVAPNLLLPVDSNHLPCHCYRFAIPTVQGGILDAPWGYVPCPEHADEWAMRFAALGRQPGRVLLTCGACGACGQSWVGESAATAKCPACGSVKEVARGEDVEG